MTDFFKPNECEINYIKLVNFAGAESNITDIFLRIEIEEDIFSSTMMGRIVLSESQDFKQNFPLIGEEKMKIKFRTFSEMKWKELEFYCYNLGDEISSGDKVAYTLNFASEEYVTSRSLRLSTPYVAQSAESITEKIIQNQLNSKKKLFSSKTADPITFIPTNIFPFTLISSLLSRSRGAKHGDYGFVFFESTDGFHFQSIDELIDETPIDYIFTNRSGILQVPDTLHVIDAYQIDESYNILERMINGSYGSEVNVFDPIRRKVSKVEFDYFDDKDYGTLNHTSGQSLKKRMQTSLFKFKDSKARMMVVDNGVRSAGRASRFARLNWIDSGFKIRVKIPGNSDFKVGDVINAKLPSGDGNDIQSGQKKEDRFLAGKYLNVSMMHIIEKKSVATYTQACEWVRDSFERNHEDEAKKLNERLA